MPKPRKSLISLEATPYYHCVARCVRRAYLCGRDQHTGIDYEHRRGWIETRILELSEIFALDVCAYAVMSNHYHVVLHINANKAKTWDTREVIIRWHKLFKGTALTQGYLANTLKYQVERDAVDALANTWREQLMSISWYMRVLNEGIAREANAEDQCTGRFWEGRFKSQALLDEKALAACMAYVDLNPVRSGAAETPETSDYTSAKKRIECATAAENPAQSNQPEMLLPFVGYLRQEMTEGLPFRLQDYLELLDWTGRHLRKNKAGAIDDALPPILARLSIEPEKWLYTSSHFENSFKSLVGTAQSILSKCKHLGYQRTPQLTAGMLLT